MGFSTASFRGFSRSDQSNHVNYELIRQGKMPQSESIFGSFLNRLLTPDDKDKPQLRKQQINGQKMPAFSKVAPYLGPGGFVAKSVKDGWEIGGGLRRKSQNGAAAAGAKFENE